MGAGVGSELIGPAVLGRSALPEGIGHGHRQLAQVDGQTRIPRSGPTAFVAEQLTQTPAREGGIGMDEAQSFVALFRPAPSYEIVIGILGQAQALRETTPLRRGSEALGAEPNSEQFTPREG